MTPRENSASVATDGAWRSSTPCTGLRGSDSEALTALDQPLASHSLPGGFCSCEHVLRLGSQGALGRDGLMGGPAVNLEQ